MVERPFIIYSLPRSRTVWLSKLLTYGDWECFHDPLAHSQPEGIACLLRMANKGIIDTGLVQHWRQMKGAIPDAKIICIHRDPLEVRSSLVKLGLNFPFTSLYQALQEVSKEPDTFNVDYQILECPEFCKKLMQHCLGECDNDWVYGKMKANIQLNIDKLRSENRML